MAFTRRNLPHWIPEENAIFVTWRLADSLPACRREEPSSGMASAGASKPDSSPGNQNQSSDLSHWLERDEQLDRERCCPAWLRDSRVASVVVNALLHGESVRRSYQLHAWVVMPNHVHAIFQPRSELPVIMRWLKGRTSRVANRILGRTGTPFWQDESFDHWMRSAEELQHLIEYVEDNPHRAGLVESRERWPWSSAG